MNKRVLPIALAALLLPTICFGAMYQIDPVHSSIGFKIRHLVGNVKGEFAKFKGTIQFDPKAPAKGSVETTVESASIDTRNERRDTHLRSADFFDVEKYPKIVFKSKKVTAKGKNGLAVAGTLTMHGVTKPVTLNSTYAGQMKDPMGNMRAAFSGTTTINRKSFGISWNKILDQGGTMLGDTVTISLEIEAILKK